MSNNQVLDSDSSYSDVSQFHHTPSYCEENVYLLCKKLCADGVADVSDLFVVFISNEHKHIPLWHQKASHRADGIILWDYHVICIQKRKEGKSMDLVWDLDATLPFPSTLASYVSESIRPSFELFSEFQRVFRVVHAPLFLRYFASDRRHMKDSKGNWMSPPPEYKPIVAEDGSVHNLNQYIEMSTKDVLKDVGEESVNAVLTKQLGVLVGEGQLEQFFSCIAN
ncbi:protein N-terminal glutamine amidohydrolase-like [Bidens hawaiensis]|uniref:protein N-terminal glutamine amidohydrolase-like n=1 Tax=Bidens hawaiensis TaxID=980011 RepID=UPI00404B525F